ncbi:MAG: MFS transporter [Chloroflexota bacterium]
MVKRGEAPKIFFGWWMVWAAAILSFWGQSLGTFGFSALFKPIAAELNFTRAATSVAAALGRLEGGLVLPFAGWAADKFGPKNIVFFGVFIAGLSLILMNFVHSLWIFYLVWGILLGTGVNMGVGPPTLDKAITNWFVRKRGSALTIRWAFFALAAVAGLPLVGWLVSTQGWRMTCVISGIIMLAVGLPLAWFFIKQHRPEYYGLLPDGATTRGVIETSQMIDQGVKYAAESDEIEFTLRQSMKTPAYWLFTAGSVAFGIVPPVLIIHAVPFLTDMGIDPLKAALLTGLMSAGSIPGTLLGGMVADRVKKQHLRFLLIWLVFVTEIIGFVIFLLNKTLIAAFPMFIFHHFAGGVWGPLRSVLLARYFGRKAFGSIQGTSTMFVLPTSVGGPILAGWVYDTTGNYMPVLVLCLVLLVLGTIFILMTSPPRPPTRITGINEIV